MTTDNHFTHLVSRLERIQPRFRFDENWIQRFSQWREQWHARLLVLLGRWPEACDPQPQWAVLEKRERYTLYHVTYETEPGLRTPALVAIPNHVAPSVPAVLCIHGHGPEGAAPVMAYRPPDQPDGATGSRPDDFGHRMAEGGMVVWAPYLRGFGPRLSRTEIVAAQQRDICNVNFFQQMLLGEVALTAQLHDLRVALTLMSEIDRVAPQSLGCAGLSYGGRLTTFLSAVDPRIAAAVVSGALNAFVERVVSYATCGYQIVPGLLREADTAELLGLIAPRLLGIELGDDDPCCPPASARAEFERAARVFQAAACPDNIRLFSFRGGHVFDGRDSIPWLQTRLAGPLPPGTSVDGSLTIDPGNRPQPGRAQSRSLSLIALLEFIRKGSDNASRDGANPNRAAAARGASHCERGDIRYPKRQGLPA